MALRSTDFLRCVGAGSAAASSLKISSWKCEIAPGFVIANMQSASRRVFAAFAIFVSCGAKKTRTELDDRH